MKTAPWDGPFHAGLGNIPAQLAGRDRETRLLERVITRLARPRPRGQDELSKPPFAPVKIIGASGAGKSVLINWAEAQARRRGVRCVSCDWIGGPQAAMARLKEDVAGGLTKLLFWFFASGSWHDRDDKLTRAGFHLPDMLEQAVRKKPLLLLIDDANRFDPSMLRTVIKASERLIGEGLPLGLVLAGKPGLDGILDKAGAELDSPGQFYIGALSDAATLEALRAPFEREGVKVAPDALRELAAQTGNYPLFIQRAGVAVWNAMARAGRDDVDAELVRRTGRGTRADLRCLYEEFQIQIAACGLLPQQERRMAELFASGGGQVDEAAVLKILAADGADDREAEEMLDRLKEKSFIWTDRGRASPGIPSLFSYIKERHAFAEAPLA